MRVNNFLLFGTMLLLIFAFANSTKATGEVTQCQDIVNSGVFNLQNDLNGISSTCFNIKTGGVTLNLNGHTLKTAEHHHHDYWSDSDHYYPLFVINPSSNIEQPIIIENGVLRTTHWGGGNDPYYDFKARNDIYGGEVIFRNITIIYGTGRVNGAIFNIVGDNAELILQNNHITTNNQNIINGNHNLSQFIAEHNSFIELTNTPLFSNVITDGTSQSIYLNVFNDSITTMPQGTYLGYHVQGSQGGWNIGNFWTNHNNNGYSDTCDDKTGNGFCDKPFTSYSPVENVTDWQPIKDISLVSKNISEIPYNVNSNGMVIGPYTPLYNCGVINQSGKYVVWGGGVLNTPDCYTITADNVLIDLDGEIITDTAGSIFKVVNATNVSIVDLQRNDKPQGVLNGYPSILLNNSRVYVKNVQFNGLNDTAKSVDGTGEVVLDKDIVHTGFGSSVMVRAFNSYFDNLYDENPSSYWSVNAGNVFIRNDFNLQSSVVGYINGALSDYYLGNYWRNDNGTGYSQTCDDTNQDGVCDTPYYLPNAVDYYPIKTYSYLSHYPVNAWSIYEQDIQGATNYSNLNITTNSTTNITNSSNNNSNNVGGSTGQITKPIYNIDLSDWVKECNTPSHSIGVFCDKFYSYQPIIWRDWVYNTSYNMIPQDKYNYYGVLDLIPQDYPLSFNNNIFRISHSIGVSFKDDKGGCYQYLSGNMTYNPICHNPQVNNAGSLSFEFRPIIYDLRSQEASAVNGIQLPLFTFWVGADSFNTYNHFVELYIYNNTLYAFPYEKESLSGGVVQPLDLLTDYYNFGKVHTGDKIRVVISPNKEYKGYGSYEVYVNDVLRSDANSGNFVFDAGYTPRDISNGIPNSWLIPLESVRSFGFYGTAGYYLDGSNNPHFFNGYGLDFVNVFATEKEGLNVIVKDFSSKNPLLAMGVLTSYGLNDTASFSSQLNDFVKVPISYPLQNYRIKSLKVYDGVNHNWKDVNSSNIFVTIGNDTYLYDSSSYIFSVGKNYTIWVSGLNISGFGKGTTANIITNVVMKIHLEATTKLLIDCLVIAG